MFTDIQILQVAAVVVGACVISKLIFALDGNAVFQMDEDAEA